MAIIIGGLAGVAIAAALTLNAVKSNMTYFFSPSEVIAGNIPANKTIRLGGLVEEKSLQREDDGLTVHFRVTDKARTINVVYTGILPDLFREGQGVIAQGKMSSDGVFLADEVLAKHDETYMPPEVAEALKKAKEAKAGDAANTSPASNGI
jgi:cytochrome c-type biogenesis protein CcmE